MFVVIFRASIRDFDEAYQTLAEKLRETALNDFACEEFIAMTEGSQEIVLSYWPDEASIKKWKAHADHLMAQKLGREKWYESYSVQVAEIKREYKV